MTISMLEGSVKRAVPAAEAPVGMAAVMRLFAEMNQSDMRYCHWKSNVRLAEGLNGKTDLDLLIDPQQQEQWRRMLQRHDLKALDAAPGKGYPGVENVLGFDSNSGRLFHLHVHYQLILGEQLVKNYVLPLHEQFLDSATVHNGVKIPAPELELIVFCIRALLKYRDRDALKDILGIRAPGLSSVILAEARWLQAQTTPERLHHALQTLDNRLLPEIVLALLTTLAENPRDGAALLRLRGRLRRALLPYRRRSQLRASLSYFRELWLRKRRRMRLHGRGLTLALVGADGAGKTTMSAQLQKWLSWKVDAHLLYLGSKKPSRRSKALYLCFRMLRRSQRQAGRLLGEQSLPARSLAQIRQIILYSHQLSLALDRRTRNRAAEALAQAGAVVLYDRFPLAPQLDGPKIRAMSNEGGSSLTERFARREQAIYDSFQQPDYLLLLDVTPDVSLQRKPDHDRAAIEAKYGALQRLFADKKSHLIRLDATQEMEAVMAQLKEKVWQIL